MKLNYNTIKQWLWAIFLFGCVVVMSASANWHFRNQKKSPTPQPTKAEIELNGNF